MSTNNLTQPNKNHKSPTTRLEILASLIADHPISRRQLIPNLLAAITLARFAVPFPPMGESPADSAIEYAPPILPPYGPPERTEVIDRWIARLDEVTTGLEKYWSFLIEARALPPAEVDGVKMVNFESEIHALADSLVGYIDCDYDGDNLITALTGRGSGPVCVEAELTSDSHVFDRAFWQREVDAVSEDHPEERGRLQALLDARYGGVR